MTRHRSAFAGAVAALALSTSGAASAGGFLDIPRTIDGYPTNVGLLILGHSTSAQGGYPAKLASALNADALGLDGRHYVVVNAVTGGDGGLLWSLLSVAPGDLRYERVRASIGVGVSPVPQWCEDATGTRWSCRRARLAEVTSGDFPIPASGTCADPTVASGCRPAAALPCTWYDRTLPLGENPVTESLSPAECWQRMDWRVALVQDTTNRSWPVDDSDRDGDVDGDDRWAVSRIRPEALPCGGGSGVVSGFVDWDCDGALGAGDSARDVYAGWLEALAADLLAAPVGAVDFVVLGHKPLELGQCTLYPESERPTCLANPHAIRTPEQIAATPDRPFDHYWVPTVAWERAALDRLFASPDLDPRILAATPGDSAAMWERSERCYVDGLTVADWSIADSVPGRPDAVAADDSESDGGGSPTSGTVGCMSSDHIHHIEAGGWMMADVWYGGLAPRLFLGVFADGFESGDAGRWSAAAPAAPAGR
jgi:hypothetical protein